MAEAEKKQADANAGAAKGKTQEEAAQPAAPIELPPEVKAMADGCFQSAEQAAMRGNLDYALTLYLEGLRYNPRDIEQGHQGLRDTSLKRAGQGKGAGLGAMISQAKGAISQMLGRTKDAMLAMEGALAKDPHNVTLLTQLMQTARRLNFTDLAIWFGELAAEEAQRGPKKPPKQIFTTLADLYEGQERFADAVNALSQAVKIDPSDRLLDKRARDLSAAASIQQGKLESVSDFHDMIRDKRTAAASATQQVVRTREQLDAQFEELKAAHEADPENAVKIQALAECEWRRGNLDRCFELLKQAQSKSGEYRYKARADDIRMAELRRKIREIDEQLQTEPDREDLKATRAKLIEQRDERELRIYRERQDQYPTDLEIRFELGMREYRNGLFDEAIVSFQQATRDPKRRILALNMLGRTFFGKNLYEEAQGQFEQAIQQYELAGDPLGKELRYNLALTLEAQGKQNEAIEWYSDIVQQDYQYRDAAKRLEALRKAS